MAAYAPGQPVSFVTDTLLWCSILEGDQTGDALDTEPRQLPAINDYLAENGHATLQRLDDKMGGEKWSQTFLYGGAFNYLNLPAFITFLKGLDWAYPEHVRVIAQEEHDDVPTMYDLHGGLTQ